MDLGLIQGGILIGLFQLIKGKGNPLSGQFLGKSKQRLYHTGIACVGTKKDQSLILFIDDAFVVNEVALKIHQFFKQPHVVRLSLDGMGEKNKG